MGLKHNAQTDELFRSILQLKDIDECYLYFEDLCTNKEIRDLGQRLEIAKQMDEGKSSLEVSASIGVSSATVGRVKRCLDYGDGGYKMILERLKQ